MLIPQGFSLFSCFFIIFCANTGTQSLCISHMYICRYACFLYILNNVYIFFTNEYHSYSYVKWSILWWHFRSFTRSITINSDVFCSDNRRLPWCTISPCRHLCMHFPGTLCSSGGSEIFAAAFVKCLLYIILISSLSSLPERQQLTISSVLSDHWHSKSEGGSQSGQKQTFADWGNTTRLLWYRLTTNSASGHFLRKLKMR